MSFKYLEHTADVMFCAEEKTIQSLFTTAANACFDVMADPKTVQDKVTRTVAVKATDIKDLMFNFLQEIIFYKDADGLVFCKIEDVQMQTKKPNMTVTATLHGDVINPKKQTLRNDIKAVTLHQFKVEQQNGEWYMQVILDI